MSIRFIMEEDTITTTETVTIVEEPKQQQKRRHVLDSDDEEKCNTSDDTTTITFIKEKNSSLSSTMMIKSDDTIEEIDHTKAIKSIDKITSFMGKPWYDDSEEEEEEEKSDNELIKNMVEEALNSVQLVKTLTTEKPLYVSQERLNIANESTTDVAATSQTMSRMQKNSKRYSNNVNNNKYRKMQYRQKQQRYSQSPPLSTSTSKSPSMSPPPFYQENNYPMMVYYEHPLQYGNIPVGITPMQQPQPQYPVKQYYVVNASQDMVASAGCEQSWGVPVIYNDNDIVHNDNELIERQNGLYPHRSIETHAYDSIDSEHTNQHQYQYKVTRQKNINYKKTHHITHEREYQDHLGKWGLYQRNPDVMGDIDFRTVKYMRLTTMYPSEFNNFQENKVDRQDKLSFLSLPKFNTKCSVYVKNLSGFIDEKFIGDELFVLKSRTKPSNVSIHRSKEDESKRYAFVCFETHEHALLLIKAILLGPLGYNGLLLDCNWANREIY